MSIWDTLSDAWDETKGALGLEDLEGILPDGKAASNYQQYNADPNAFEYGGVSGKAEEDANYYRGRTDQGVKQANRLQQGANAQQANQNQARRMQVGAMGTQANAMGDQRDAMAIQRNAALGNAPSRAEMLARSQSDRAMAGQQSMAASARSPAGLAMAQQNAAANMARQQTDITNNASQMRAEEMSQARNAYAGQTNAYANQANAYANQANQVRSADNANQSLQQQGALGYQNAAQGWSQGERDVRKSQQQGMMGREALNSSNYNTAEGARTASQEAAAGRKSGALSGAVSGGMAMLPMLASDERTKVASENDDSGFSKFMQDFGDKYASIAGGMSSSGLGAKGGPMGAAGPAMGGFGPNVGGGSDAMNKTVGAGISGLGSLISDITKKKRVSDAEAATMSARADDLRASQAAGYSSPAAMEQYLKSTSPAAYEYKRPEYGSPGVHVGPASAQEMAKNPIGSTIVKKDPNTGMLAMEPDKAIKTTMSATSYVNDKADAALAQSDLLLDLIGKRNEGWAKSKAATDVDADKMNRESDDLQAMMKAMYGQPNATRGMGRP